VVQVLKNALVKICMASKLASLSSTITQQAQKGLERESKISSLAVTEQ